MKNIPLRIATKKKVVTGVIVAVFLLAVVLLGQDYGGHEGAKVLGQNASVAVDSAQLEKDYQADFKKIIGAYLASMAARNLDETALAQTQASQQRILALKVPAAFKDYHLETVLLLGDIADAITAKNDSAFSTGIKKLEEILSHY